MGAEALAQSLLVLQFIVIGEFAEVIQAFFRIDIEPLVAILVDDGLGDILHVGARVAVFGQFGVDTQQLLITDDNGVAEVVHLRTVVVDVVLFFHVIARMAHDTCGRIAKRSPTAMAYMVGTGGVCGNIFQVHPARTVFQGSLSEIETLSTNIGSNALESGRRKTNVDEAGTGDFNAFDQIVFGQMLDDSGCDISGIALGDLRAAHCNRRGPVAIGQVSGSLQRSFGNGRQFQGSVFVCGDKGLFEDLFQLFANLHLTSRSFQSSSGLCNSGTVLL